MTSINDNNNNDLPALSNTQLSRALMRPGYGLLAIQELAGNITELDGNDPVDAEQPAGSNILHLKKQGTLYIRKNFSQVIR